MVPQHAVAEPAPNSEASVAEPAPNGEASVAEPVPEGKLFTKKDAIKLMLQQTGQRDHEAILAELEHLVKQSPLGSVGSVPCRPELWQPWVAVRYIDWIGPGMLRAFWQFRSVKDPERGLCGSVAKPGDERQLRLDLICVRSDRRLVLLHPGKKPRLSTEPELVASDAFVK